IWQRRSGLHMERTTAAGCLAHAADDGGLRCGGWLPWLHLHGVATLLWWCLRCSFKGGRRTAATSARRSDVAGLPAASGSSMINPAWLP
uniref:Uncharacterized protein n=1 Tax=Aegilops tauschii subsp. strangulata TaxID=200361 RepID=A0A453KXV8_AEGTS